MSEISKEIRRTEILKAAQELFNKRGFENTAVIDIMKKVGIAKGAFYYYFESKESILDALVDLSISCIEESMINIANKSDINALEKLRLMLTEEIRLTFENYDSSNHVHDIKNVDMHQKIMVGINCRISPLIGNVIEQGIQEGIFRTKYPLEITEILITGIHIILDLGIFSWSNQQYFARIKAAEELIEKSLSLDEGSFSFLVELLTDIPKITGLTIEGANNEI